MTVRPAVVRARLAHLGFALVQLERLRQLPPADRQRDPLHRMAVEHYVAVDAARIWQVLDDHLANLSAVHQALGALPELVGS